MLTEPILSSFYGEAAHLTEFKYYGPIVEFTFCVLRNIGACKHGIYLVPLVRAFRE